MAQETQVVDLLNSSAANDTVRKVTTTPIGVIQERSLTDVPTIRTMSLDPTYQGKVQLSTPVFFSRAFERGLFVISGDSWATDTKELDAVHALGSVLLRVSYTARTHSVVELEEALLLIGTRARARDADSGRLHIGIRYGTARTSQGTTTGKGIHVRRGIDRVPGAEFATSRSLVVPAWEDIKANYPAPVAEDLTSFIDRGSKQSGRLLLWHGLPGTGKTYALRALAREGRGEGSETRVERDLGDWRNR